MADENAPNTSPQTWELEVSATAEVVKADGTKEGDH